MESLGEDARLASKYTSGVTGDDLSATIASNIAATANMRHHQTQKAYNLHRPLMVYQTLGLSQALKVTLCLQQAAASRTRVYLIALIPIHSLYFP